MSNEVSMMDTFRSIFGPPKFYSLNIAYNFKNATVPFNKEMAYIVLANTQGKPTFSLKGGIHVWGIELAPKELVLIACSSKEFECLTNAQSPSDAQAAVEKIFDDAIPGYAIIKNMLRGTHPEDDEVPSLGETIQAFDNDEIAGKEQLSAEVCDLFALDNLEDSVKRLKPYRKQLGRMVFDAKLKRVLRDSKLLGVV